MEYAGPYSATLNARDNVPGVQALVGLGGPAFLNGSNGSDVFLISSDGTTANGGAGDDGFALGGMPLATNFYSGLHLDGGDGFDKLVVDGDFQISNSFIANIEVLTLHQNLNAGGLPPHLSIDTATVGTKPIVEIEGTGAVTLNLSNKTFSGAGVTFTAGAAVKIDIHGTALADTITGTSADDWIFGNGGNDWLRGALGNDYLSGGDGNDRLEGGQGNDWLLGGLGNDVLSGGTGNDTADYSYLVATPGATGVTVNLGISGAQDTGLGGIDTLSGIESLTGSAYNDILIGNAGSNVLEGGAGSDVLIGGKGQDTLIGGSGADIFVFQALADSLPGASSRDQIFDFSHLDGDRIDLSAIDANTAFVGDQAFFLGGSAFTHHAGEIVQTASGSDWVVKTDVNGDGVADFALLLKGIAAPLGAADFIL